MTNREIELVERFADDSLGEAGLQELAELAKSRADIAEEIVEVLLITGVARQSDHSDERSARLQEMLKRTIPSGSIPGQTEKQIMSVIRDDRNRRSWFRIAVPLAAAAALAAAVGVWWVMERGTRNAERGIVVARVVEVGDQSSVLSDPLGKRRAEVGMEVRAGARIETGEKGRVILAYVGEETRVELAEGTGFRVQGAGKTGKQIVLEKGKLIASVAKQPEGSPLVVETPNARMTVLGTRLSAKATPGMTRLDVEAGQVRTDRLSDGATTNVPAGHFTIVRDRIELAAYPAGTRYIKGRLIVQENFEKELEQWELVHAPDAKMWDESSDRAFFPLPANAQELECRIVPRFDGQLGKCLLLSTERAQGQFAGLRLKRSIGLIPFVMEWNVYTCTKTFGKRAHLTNIGAAWGRFINTIYDNSNFPSRDAWLELRTEWIPAEASYGKNAWQIDRYLDNRLVGKDIAEDTKTTRFPLIAVAHMKAYADNIRIWELVAVDKIE
ncbi:MAG: hypothetical protein C0404_12065 [Verrucomicrobia bacterium]|nr:hypothetical protein [Verrucomicrobiota bacterium]